MEYRIVRHGKGYRIQTWDRGVFIGYSLGEWSSKRLARRACVERGATEDMITYA